MGDALGVMLTGVAGAALFGAIYHSNLLRRITEAQLRLPYFRWNKPTLASAMRVSRALALFGVLISTGVAVAGLIALLA